MIRRNFLHVCPHQLWEQPLKVARPTHLRPFSPTWLTLPFSPTWLSGSLYSWVRASEPPSFSPPCLLLPLIAYWHIHISTYLSIPLSLCLFCPISFKISAHLLKIIMHANCVGEISKYCQEIEHAVAFCGNISRIHRIWLLCVKFSALAVPSEARLACEGIHWAVSRRQKAVNNVGERWEDAMCDMESWE